MTLEAVLPGRVARWWWRWICVSRLFAVAPLSLAGTSVPPPAEPVTAAVTLPPAQVGALRTFCFPIHNENRQPLRLRSVRSSCSCLLVLRYPAVVPAGDSAQVWAAIVPSQPGTFKHRLWLLPVGREIAEISRCVTGTATGAEIAHGDLSLLWELPPALLTWRHEKPPGSHLVEPAALDRDLRHEKRWLLLDVRSESAFRAARIPGAIHMPRHALQRASFLRGRPVLLIDESGAAAGLLHDAAELKKTGAEHVAVLAGGITYWAWSGRPLQGPPRARLRLPMITASAYRLMRDGVDTVVTLSATVTDACDVLFPGHRALAPDASAEALQEALRTDGHTAKGDSIRNVLFVNHNGEYGEFQAALRRSCPDELNPLFLEGGWPALVRYLQGSARDTERTTVAGSGRCADCP